MLATGHVTKGNSSVVASFTVPEAASGIHYVRFVRVLTDERFGFYFVVEPRIKVIPSSAKVGNTVTVVGTGFPEETMVLLTLDGKNLGLFASTNNVGSFTSSFLLPDTSSGWHRILVDGSSINTIDAAIEILPKENTIGNQSSSVGDYATESGTNNNSQPIVDRSPPPSPTAVSPMGHSFGLFGTKSITFTWVGVSDPSGVTYTLEIANDVAFSMLKPGMQKAGLIETSCTVDVSPGIYYWRVKSIDGAGNESYWSYAPYAFRVAEISALIDELLHFLWSW